jgi:outer membrane protein TolC
VSTARVLLNRVLHRPQQEMFLAEEPGLNDPAIVERDRLRPFVDNPRSFATFGAFLVGEGFAASPELMALDAAIAAQERDLLTARRSFWAPEISAFGELTEGLDEGAAHAPPDPFPLTYQGNDTDWAVGINLTLPLYTGGDRAAVVRQTTEVLEGLLLDRDATAERVELAIRTSLHDVAATSSAIQYNRESAEAAHKNLDLITDQYSRGVVPIIVLLDAQNAALQADEQAANSVYDFLIDVMQLQRAASNFNFFTSPAEREDWFERLEAFYREAGVSTGS